MYCYRVNTHKVLSSNGVSAQVSGDKYTLSNDQREFYEKNGYLVIGGLTSFDILYACKQRFQNICNGRVPKGSMVLMKEIALMKSGVKGEHLINKIQDILFDDVFSMYTENEKLLDVISQLIGPNIVAIHSMLINKPPGTGEHPPHQDLHYFPLRPVEKIIAAWTAMEEVDRDNGCLYVVPGSHLKGILYQHDYPKSKDGIINKAYHGILDELSVTKDEDRIYLSMSPGDTVLFHPLLVHGSVPNISKRFRKAISCHYASSDCFIIDTSGTSQHNIALEVENMAKKMGFEADFQAIFKYRSKVVRGVKSSL